MRIAFVTSCLEPRCDGVGDYTTLLAQECARHGHDVTCIALNDPFIKQSVESERLARFSSHTPWRDRAKRARAVLETFAPDWISLQFVCYGFHPRGFSGGVNPFFNKIFAGWPLQVFFHELWLGENCGAPRKERAFGWLQRRGVLAMLRSLAPRLVHTSNEAYVHLLGLRGITARRLPLFGPLPLPDAAPVRKPGTLTFCLFGTLHPIWPPEPLFSHLRAFDLRVTFAHAGRIGSGEALWSRMEREYRGAISFRRLGELPPQEIANFFASCDFGIATTPWAIIGKSASVAAMIDAGLPVIVNRDDIQFSGFDAPAPDHPLLLRMEEDLPDQLFTTAREAPRLRLPEIADQFLADWAAHRSASALNDCAR